VNPTAKPSQLIERMLQLAPRLAVFDCDGTLWSGDAGEGFFDWELSHGIVADEVVSWARARYADYKAGKVSEDAMCSDMVTLHKGLREEDLLEVARRFFEDKFLNAIFPEMRELVLALEDAGSEVWAVSSTNEWLIRVAMDQFRIPRSKILAASARVEGGVITDQIVRIPTGIGKAKAIFEVIGRPPDAGFGNSRWDVEMLAIARYAVAVNPNPDLETQARERGWTIYWPEGTRDRD